MASLYERYVVPWLISCACASPAIAKQRAKIVPLAAGKVLEVGIGGALNLPYYDAAAVTELIGVDPSEGLRRRAENAAAESGLRVKVVDGAAEALPFEHETFDSVVCTFTLCSIADPGAALAEARRVLKPAGRLFFCEHGLAPDAEVVKWQRRIEPVWKRIAGGCHLTRRAPDLIEAAGFRIESRESMYLPRTPRWAGWNEWGAAVRA